jgi:methylated-DNA-[protein]-cysteine S-methyltransferase
MDTKTWVYESTVGRLFISGDGEAVTGLVFENKATLACEGEDKPWAVQRCMNELDAYFAGTLQEFTVPLKPQGTTFRKRVWDALREIPYGQTINYGMLAKKIGNPKAARAVGGANHHNPIAIIIPCHRVIGADGKLTGFGGGLDVKAFLLDHEKRHI